MSATSRLAVGFPYCDETRDVCDERHLVRRVTPASSRLRLGVLVESLLQRVPRQRRALDAHRKLDDALECLEVAESYTGQFRGQVAAVAFAVAFELGLVDRHQRLERSNELMDL